MDQGLLPNTRKGFSIALVTDEQNMAVLEWVSTYAAKL
jgi:hypothetical protein